MKSVSVISGLCLSSMLAEGSHLPNGEQLPLEPNEVSLEEVYGDVDPVSEMERWDDRQTVRKNRAIRPESYYAKRTPEHCIFPLELVIVQDATHSFTDDFEHMRDTQLEAMYNALSTSHPNSTFGVASLRDIPIWSLGEPETDYCYKEEQALTNDFDKIRDVYGSLTSTGGGDPNEAQFLALIAAAKSSTVGWKDPDATRVIVLITDAAPHFEGDGHNLYGLAPYSEVTTAENCAKQYYPGPTAVKQALISREAYLVQLVYDGFYFQGGYPADAWSWFNSFLNQTSDFLAPLAEDSSNFWSLLSSTIRQIEELECVVPTAAPTTTPEVVPTTVTTTTVPVTTTTTVPTTVTTTTTTVPTTVATTTVPVTTTTTVPTTVATTTVPVTTTTTVPTTVTTTTTTVPTTVATTTVPVTTTVPTTVATTTVPVTTTTTVPNTVTTTTTTVPTTVTTTTTTVPTTVTTTTVPVTTATTVPTVAPTTTPEVVPTVTPVGDTETVVTVPITLTTLTPTAVPVTTPLPTTVTPAEVTTTPPTCLCPPSETDCGCPAVKIVLQDKPALLKLEVVNDE